MSNLVDNIGSIGSMEFLEIDHWDGITGCFNLGQIWTIRYWSDIVWRNVINGGGDVRYEKLGCCRSFHGWGSDCAVNLKWDIEIERDVIIYFVQKKKKEMLSYNIFPHVIYIWIEVCMTCTARCLTRPELYLILWTIQGFNIFQILKFLTRFIDWQNEALLFIWQQKKSFN